MISRKYFTRQKYLVIPKKASQFLSLFLGHRIKGKYWINNQTVENQFALILNKT